MRYTISLVGRMLHTLVLSPKQAIGSGILFTHDEGVGVVFIRVFSSVAIIMKVTNNLYMFQ